MFYLLISDYNFAKLNSRSALFYIILVKKRLKEDSIGNVACQFIIFAYAQQHIHFMHYVCIIRIKIGPEGNNKENKECFSMT